MKIPSHYLPVMPYLIVNEAHDFLNFTKAVFDATEQLIIPRENGKIMHGEIRIFDAVIMFSHASDEYPVRTAGMFLYVDNVDEVYNKALYNGSQSIEAPAEKDYGYTAAFKDHFGNHWFIVQGEVE